MAHALKADVIVMKMKKGREGKVAEVMIRQNQKDGKLIILTNRDKIGH